MALDALPGNPGAFERSLGAYSRGAAAIEDAISALDQLSSSSHGEAMDAVRGRVTVVRTGITDARGRYDQTAYALGRYAEDFKQAHARANRAIDAHEAAVGNRAWAARRVDQLEDDLRVAAQSAAPDADRQAIEAQLYRAKDSLREAGWAVEGARGDYADAERDLDQAAQYAISAIDSVFGQTNDSWTDHVGAFIDSVGDFFAAIGEWISGVLKGILDFLVDAILVLLDALAAVLIALTLLLVLIFPFYFVAVGLIALALFGLTELLGVPDQWQLWIVTGFLGVAVPTLGAFILNRAVHEALSPTPSITYADSADEVAAALGDDHDALDDQQSEDIGALTDPDYIPTDVGTLIERVGHADAVGGDHHTVLDIVTIIDQYGNERHIVTMPSTADWGHISELMGNGGGLGEGGATNDLDANLVEMLFPGVIDTQYERAALEALRQLVDSGEPVMFVGFSQGGIMSSLMVDQHGAEFNTQALVTAGTPHSTFAIPKTVEHFNVAHVGDAVAMLDMSIDGNVNEGMHRSVVAYAQPGKSTHSAESYGHTASLHTYASDGLFADFLVDPADVMSGKVAVTSTQAIWSEG